MKYSYKFQSIILRKWEFCLKRKRVTANKKRKYKLKQLKFMYSKFMQISKRSREVITIIIISSTSKVSSYVQVNYIGIHPFLHNIFGWLNVFGFQALQGIGSRSPI